LLIHHPVHEVIVVRLVRAAAGWEFYDHACLQPGIRNSKLERKDFKTGKGETLYDPNHFSGYLYKRDVKNQRPAGSG
jgi:hypothetical protein